MGPFPSDASVLEQARWFVARGLSVIPIPRPGQGHDGKVPAIPWAPYQLRLANDAELVSWFSDAPMNIGIVTGAISGFVFVDGDTSDACRWIVGHLPYTPLQTKTARGYHYGYRCPDVPIGNKARVETRYGRLPIDIRGAGGYVIGPGSVHAGGHVYLAAGDWTAPRARVPFFWPGWLQRSQPVPAAPVRPVTRPAGDVVDRARRYLAAIPVPIIGAGSDSATLYAACRIMRGFDLSEADAIELLWDWCGSRPGWTHEWVAQKVRHARRYGSEAIGGLR